MTIIDTINQRLSGKTFKCSDLENTLLNNPEYKKRLDSEANKISDSNPERSIFNVYSRTLQGHIAEILLLEDEVIGPLLERANKRYHDFFVPSENCFLEVKNYAPQTLTSNVNSWLKHDAYEYNTSKYLVVFQIKNGYLTLNQAIEVVRDKSADIVSDLTADFSVEKRGKTFSLTLKTLNRLLRTNANIEFLNDDKSIIKTASWFSSKCRPSKFNDTVYVFENDVA